MAATSAEAVAGTGLVESSTQRPADLAAKDVREWVHDPGVSILPGLDTLGLRHRIEDILALEETLVS